MKIRHLNDTDVEALFEKEKDLFAVVLTSYESIPCQHFEPELRAIAEIMDGRLRFYRVNATENPAAAEYLGVDAVPTVIIFRDREEIAKYEGPYSKEALQERLGALLKRTGAA